MKSGIVLIIVVILLLNLGQAIAKRRIVHIERIEICDRTPNAAFIINDLRYSNNVGQNVILNLNGTMLRDLDRLPTLKVEMTRCLHKEVLDSCIPFTTINPLSSCELLEIKNMAWSQVVYAFKPPMVCPVLKGDYILENGTFDANLFNIFPIDNYYWRMKLFVLEGLEYITICVDIKILLLRH